MKHWLRKGIVWLLSAVMLLSAMPLTAAAENTNGSFTAATLNVDGLPQKILGISINSDGPGSDGTKAISQAIAERGWDILGVSEDFNYNTELLSALTDYNNGTHGGSVSGLYNDTDGLNLIWKKTISVSGEKMVSWNDNYSSGIFGTGNGADTMIDKGYRYYAATVAEGVTVDIYIMHMDADSDAEDIAARESQLTQLAAAIKASDNKNPILVMGDTNCRYTRENLETLFIDVINADSRFTIQDAWIEKVRGGEYPVYGSDAIVAVDKGGTYEYPEAEIVDKVFYINNTDSDVTLTADSYTVDTTFVDDSGTALADHWPVVVEFSYEVAGSEPEVHEHSYSETSRTEATCTEDGVIYYSCACGETEEESIPAIGHSYSAVVTAPTCQKEGYTTYTCGNCGDSYTADTTSVVDHDYVDGICSMCGKEDETAAPEEPVQPDNPEETVENILGAATTEITSGQKYALVFSGTTGKFAMKIDENLKIVAESFDTAEGEVVEDSQIWTITEESGGYSIATEIDGTTYYLCRTKSFTGVGYKLGLQETSFVWQTKVDTSKNSVRFYTKSYGRSYYLRYYNAKAGWIATVVGAGLKVYEIN